MRIIMYDKGLKLKDVEVEEKDRNVFDKIYQKVMDIEKKKLKKEEEENL